MWAVPRICARREPYPQRFSWVEVGTSLHFVWMGGNFRAVERFHDDPAFAEDGILEVVHMCRTGHICDSYLVHMCTREDTCACFPKTSGFVQS